ncbi:hypothetical protein B0A55_03083 [Friedmanniomyces simplex]|uniref:Uncharacterized protein n=1 Tax=Friedmanniomyces simplex TaxID=329884 RepID=A0A4U0XJ28_9PEZI|nr:hypothetical protein B0A55_03083 [Friedmanniomyces simplex]
MARMSRRTVALLALGALPLAYAQLTSVPDLSTATQTAASSSATTATSDATTTPAATLLSSSGTATTSASVIHYISNIPTIAGAGIPTLVIPYTAAAPFMQKSKMPEGTVFIAVGACLAFLGACVLLWRGLVAWSINRSVKRSALASIRGSEKNSGWGGSSGYNPVHGNLYKDTNGSSMSLDALTSAGKPVKPHFRDHEIKRESTPPAGLFFSPTAQAGREVQNNRNSSYLPAGYYASPSAQAAGGAGATTIGGSLAPYARHSVAGISPPSSPGPPPTSRSSATYRATSRDGLRTQSRDGLRAQSRDGLRGQSRDGYGAGSARNSYLEGPRQGHSSALYAQPSSSSLMVGIGGNGYQSGENLAGSRAPSAYLEDLFENHGNGPREQF